MIVAGLWLDQAGKVLLRNTPRHSQGEILLKIGAPSVDRASRMDFAGIQILIPSIIRFSKLSAPAWLGRIVGQVAAFR